MPRYNFNPPMLDRKAKNYMPPVEMTGRWHLTLEKFIREHRPEYIHARGRWRGQINIWHLAQASGINYYYLVAWVKGDLSHLGLQAAGRLAYALHCLPTDFLTWEAFPKDPELRNPADYARPEGLPEEAGRKDSPEGFPFPELEEEEEYTRDFPYKSGKAR